MTTFPTAERADGDASAFLDAVDRVIAGLVFRYRPPLVCCVRIHKWFDHKWLEFSGKGRVFFDPPWPSHVGVAEHHWERQGNGSYARAEARFLIHRPERQHSSNNLQRRIIDLTDSALFVWFSSTSAKDTRGSMLVYVVNEGATIPWFASMTCDSSTWTLGEVKGLGRPEVEELLQHPPCVQAAI